MVTIVDGLVRFDREKDADDMRIMIDPKEPFDAAAIHTQGDLSDNCMKDAEELYYNLFDLK
jgi:hypothetical protein